jgi:hypothetical protein
MRLPWPLVRIVGRPEGFLSFLLTIMGIGSPTEFVVTRRSVNFKTANLLGASQFVAPVAHVSTAMGGYAKPIQYLITGVMAFGFGLLGTLATAAGREFSILPLLGGVLVGGILMAVYFMRKTLTIGVITTGGVTFGLTFKSSIIEGKSIGFDDAMRVVNIVRDVVLDGGRPQQNEAQPGRYAA